MASIDIDHASPTFVWTRLALTLAAFGLSVYILCSLLSKHDGKDSHLDRIARKHLRQVIIALQAYHEKSGLLPYDSAGSDSALYLLRGSVCVSAFSSPSQASAAEPYWDQEHRRIANSAWSYLNPPASSHFRWRQIVVMSTEPTNCGVIYLGCRGPQLFAKRMKPCSALLGSFISTDNFILADERLFKEWSRLEPAGGILWSATKDGLLVEAVGSPQRLIYRYEYVGSQLVKRIVSFRSEEIQEHVLTDRCGRITQIARTPSDWETLWARWTNAEQ